MVKPSAWDAEGKKKGGGNVSALAKARILVIALLAGWVMSVMYALFFMGVR